jgi:hypothetical protein
MLLKSWSIGDDDERQYLLAHGIDKSAFVQFPNKPNINEALWVGTSGLGNFSPKLI